MYLLYKFNFSTPFRFGESNNLGRTGVICHSDTVFSALCLEYLKLKGDKDMDSFIRSFKISSLFPYKGEELYLPKPMDSSFIKGIDKEEDKKKFKKARFVKTSLELAEEGVYKKGERTNVSVSRTGEDATPYFVGTAKFVEGCGLWCLAEGDEKGLLLKLFESIGLTGIGGKRSAGLGKFSVEATEEKDIPQELKDLLAPKKGYRMALSLVSPSASDLERFDRGKCCYKLIKRSGFAADLGLKHKELALFQEGACFDFDIEGEIKECAPDGSPHPVYKYGKMLGIYF